ncbi:hypothetical protein [Peptostreptococcus sp. D1]|uniref:hypothetical protein n=1 Tax=Peptostreptococcus sp. D1 TaxID=72304 RepID=UPI0008F2534B|nr:hypothetical protein [Peptostreptococcus sp. D1]SFE44545.1 hypothetical protein SAMN02910278_00863 [Peptostreptococcus sp. D1]
MKKFLIGAIAGAAAIAIGYKLVKDNEEEVKSFISNHFGNDLEVDIEDLDVKELEELRSYVDEIIEEKDMDKSIDYDDYASDYNSDGENNDYEEYIDLSNLSPEK